MSAKEIYAYGRKYKNVIKEQEYDLLNQKKELSAKEMFEELGYKEAENDIYFLKYYKPGKLSHDKEIKFHKLDKSITVKDDNRINYRWFNMKELQAINKQAEELGWLDE